MRRSFIAHNASHRRQKKAERKTSGTFLRPYVCASHHLLHNAP